MSIQKEMSLRTVILSGLLLGGGCGEGTPLGMSPQGDDDGQQAPSDEALGEEHITNECPGYGWTFLQTGTPEDDEAVAIAVDDECAGYIAGNTRGTLTIDEESRSYQDGFLSRLPNDTSSGWTHQFGTDGEDEIRGLAVSAPGRSYVVGNTQPGGTPLLRTDVDALTASFDRDGTSRWQVAYGTAEDEFGISVALKKDSSPLVVGASFTNLLFSSELWLTELAAADGKQEKETLLGTPEYDRAEGVTIDASSGNIFLCGSTAGDMGATNRGSADVFVRKQKPDHTTEWNYQIGTDDVDVAQRVVRDSNGNLYVLALSYSDLVSGATENDGRISPFVIKLDKNGGKRWIVRLTNASTHTQARGLALGPMGDLYVAGSTLGQIGKNPSSGGWDAYVIKLSGTDGKIKWTKQFGTSGEDYATGVVVSPNGRILLSGFTTGAMPGNANAGKRDAFVANISPKSTEF